MTTKNHPPGHPNLVNAGKGAPRKDPNGELRVAVAVMLTPSELADIQEKAGTTKKGPAIRIALGLDERPGKPLIEVFQEK